jgi:hypothetical protein
MATVVAFKTSTAKLLLHHTSIIRPVFHESPRFSFQNCSFNLVLNSKYPGGKTGDLPM